MDPTDFPYQAVILVGGRGSRLGSLTETVPKPLMPVGGGMSFLDVLIENIARYGYRQILLLAGHLGEQVRERYDGRNIRSAELKVLVEPEPQGTAGALVFAHDHLAPVFLFTNGDSLFDINYLIIARLMSPSTIGALALRSVENSARYGTVALADGMVTEFREKTGREERALINGGVGVFKRGVVERIDRVPCSLEIDIFPKLAQERKLAGTSFEGYFIDIGIPETLTQARETLGAWRTRPIAFLDRDGVLNVDTGWPHRPDQLVMIEEAGEAVRLLNECGFYVVVVSNQAGVAHGYYNESQVDLFNAALYARLAGVGAHIDATYFCPHHPLATVQTYRLDSPDRKPRPGMLLKALRDWPSRKAGSFLIGDKPSDLHAAAAAGVPGYLFTGGSLAAFVASVPEVIQSCETSHRKLV